MYELATDEPGNRQKWENVHVEISIDATPRQIYGSWLNGRVHSQMLGMPVDITDEVGTRFEIQNPSPNKLNPTGATHSGIIVDLTEGSRIIQAWRHSAWEEGVYSILTIRFVAEGGGTRLILDQKGVPPGWGSRLEGGWGGFILPKVQVYFAHPHSLTS